MSTTKPTTADLRSLEKFVDEAEAQGALWWQEQITVEIREARSYLQQGNWSEAIRRAKSAAAKEDQFGKSSSTVAARFLAAVKALKQRYEVHGENNEAALRLLREELQRAEAEKAAEPAPEITPEKEEPVTKNDTEPALRFLTDEEIQTIKAKGPVATQGRLLGLATGYLQGAIDHRRKMSPALIGKILGQDSSLIADTAEADRRGAIQLRTDALRTSISQSRRAKNPAPVRTSDDGKNRDSKPEKPTKPAPVEPASDEGKILDPSTNPENPRARTVPMGEPLGAAPLGLRVAVREIARSEDSEPTVNLPLLKLDQEIQRMETELEVLRGLRSRWSRA